MARRSSVQQQQVCRRLRERPNTSSIIPNHPPHAARVAMSATALTDSRPPSAPCAQSDAAQPWPSQQRCGVVRPKKLVRLGSLVAGQVPWALPRRAAATGTLRARSVHVLRALSVCLCRWGGVGVSEYVRTRLYVCILVFRSSLYAHRI